MKRSTRVTFIETKNHLLYIVIRKLKRLIYEKTNWQIHVFMYLAMCFLYYIFTVHIFKPYSCLTKFFINQFFNTILNWSIYFVTESNKK